MIDTKLLRQKLIDIAMRGLLVEQRSEEGNASDLLEQIRAEKAALIKKGQIKKEKPLPEIKEEEKPFAIPDSWCWVRLEQLKESCDYSFADGPFGSNLKKEHYTDKHEVRIIQLGNIGDYGWRDENKKYTTFEHLNEISRSEAKAGDIVIAKMMPAGRAVEVPNLDSKFVLSSDAIKFLPSHFLCKKFVLFAINSVMFKKQVDSGAHGTTRIRTSLSSLKAYVLPLPPLAEQKRIVAALEASLKLVDTIAKDSADLDKALNFLRQKVLDMAMRGLLVEQRSEEGNATDLLEQIRAEKAALIKKGKIKKEKPLPEIKEEEKPFAIPDSWCWVRLGEIGISQTGKTPPTNNDEFWGNDTPFITPGDILNGSISYTNRSVSFAGEEFSRVVLSGAILQVCIGGSIGKIGIVDRKICFNQQINAVTTVICNALYLYFAMQNESFTSILKRRACGTATPIINLSTW